MSVTADDRRSKLENKMTLRSGAVIHSITKKDASARNYLTRNTALRIEGCEMASSLDEAIALCNPAEENFIIGGGEIYRQAMPLADKLYITHIAAEFEGDTRFPTIGPEWKEIAREEFPRGEKFPHPFAFVDYVRG